jgi:hypothetical protein
VCNEKPRAFTPEVATMAAEQAFVLYDDAVNLYRKLLEKAAKEQVLAKKMLGRRC